MTAKYQQGVTLVSVLLFLTVISVLVVAVIENNILQTKISNLFLSYICAFENAEALLYMAKTDINMGSNQGESSLEGFGDYHFTKVKEDCNNLYYEVIADGESLNANVKLESKVGLVKHVNCEGKLQQEKKYTVYWLSNN